MRMRHFWIGFGVTFLVFLGLNLLSAHLRSDCGLGAWLGLSNCADDLRRAGFPWVIWEQGGFIGLNIFRLPALLGDLAVGIIISLLGGWQHAARLARRDPSP